MLFAIVGVILWTQMDDRTIANVLKSAAEF